MRNICPVFPNISPHITGKKKIIIKCRGTDERFIINSWYYIHEHLQFSNADPLVYVIQIVSIISVGFAPGPFKLLPQQFFCPVPQSVFHVPSFQGPVCITGSNRHFLLLYGDILAPSSLCPSAQRSQQTTAQKKEARGRLNIALGSVHAAVCQGETK